MKKLKNFIEDLFKITEWKTVFTCSCKAYHYIIFVGAHQIDAKVFLKVSTNLHTPNYKCYLSDGVNKQSLELETIIAEYPNVCEILKQYNIEYDK